jgi:hypothetical protein
LRKLNYVAFLHFESDEWGGMAFLDSADARLVCNDLSSKSNLTGWYNIPADHISFWDNEILKTGRRRFKFVMTPHVHHWDSMMIFEESTQSLFPSDQLGHQLVDAVTDFVIGVGPHNMQQIEEYNGRLILYSMGNFLYVSKGSYDKFNANPFGLVARLVFQINNTKNPTNQSEQDNADNYIPLTKVKKILKVYPIMTDNIKTNWQGIFLEEQEFKIAHVLLIDKNSFLKSSKRPAKAGIDRIGRFLEVQLD